MRLGRNGQMLTRSSSNNRASGGALKRALRSIRRSIKKLVQKSSRVLKQGLLPATEDGLRLPSASAVKWWEANPGRAIPGGEWWATLRSADVEKLKLAAAIAPYERCRLIGRLLRRCERVQQLATPLPPARGIVSLNNNSSSMVRAAARTTFALCALVAICVGISLLLRIAIDYRAALRLARQEAERRAATTVQTFARRRLARSALRSSLDAAITLQSHARVQAPRRLLRASRDAAIALQSLARMQVATRLLRAGRDAATTVQREARRMFAISALRTAIGASVCLQSHARMVSACLNLRKSRGAATALQAATR